MNGPASPLPTALAAALAADTADVGREPRVHALFSHFLSARGDRGLLWDLLDAARGRGGDPWEIRRLAALLLQRQVLRIPPGRWRVFDELFLRLGIKAGPGLHVPLDEEVLREGYSTADLRGFIPEFLRNLGRPGRILEAIRGRRTSRGAWEDFLACARQEHRLALGRYLFTPAEVVARILGQVRVSRGVLDPFPGWGFPDGQEAGGLSLPRYEAEIAAGLARGGRICWVSEATSSELGALVEYPLTTVVLVVKPPGSGLELELKRAGRRASRPLSVVFEREDGPVPISHRLDGGSMARALHWDAWAASRLAGVYRQVHGAEAPLSGTLSVSTVYSVPLAGGEASILDYFTRRDVFGDGFEEMRAAMGEATAAFAWERNWSLPELPPGRLGLTVRFLNYTAPAQAVLAGTSSFRLDRAALYLSPEGPEAYFTHGLGVPWSRDDARRLADQVLEEVLGVYAPPAGPYRDPGRYVEAALAVPENRARADSIFLAAAREIGRLWGTLLGVRGFSRGESFVPRNVGLKASWREGRWRVGLVFMDHDDLVIDPEVFAPLAALPAMLEDERYVGRALACLGRIYRPEAGVARAGRDALREEAVLACRGTRAAVRGCPDVRDLFSPGFVERLGDWDLVVQRFLAASEGEDWQGPVRELLGARGYDPERVEEHVEALESFADFLRRTSFLYG
ncbi:MAG TPA: hypothetical protein VHC97_13735 [Thermoanaerobaculia bacterium]|nr:hypothetical protein [Thermoanaerobaculia bacterium]